MDVSLGDPRKAFHSVVSRIGNPYTVATAAEHDASKRVAEARESVQKAQQQAETEIEQKRDEYRAQEARESLNHQNALSSEEQASYEALRRLRSQYQVDSQRIQSQGERDLARLKEYYDVRGYQNARDGEKQLKEHARHQQLAMDAESRQAQEQRTFFRQDQSNRMQALQDERAMLELEKEREKQQVIARSRQELETHKEHHEAYLQAHQKMLQDQQKTLMGSQQMTRDRLAKVILASEVALSRYDDKQDDPFYRPIDLRTRVSEHEEYYELRAEIPEHEREGLVVSGNLNEIILSGSRKFSQKYLGDRGQKKESSAFQSYSEVIPVKAPIDPRFIQKYFDGSDLVAIVPKAGTDYLRTQQLRKADRNLDLGLGPTPVQPRETMAANKTRRTPGLG